MAKPISAEQIQKIYELYGKYGVKKRVAEELGISASTVTKYLNMAVEPEPEIPIIPFSGGIPTSISPLFSSVKNWGMLCALSDEEKEGIEALQKEIAE
jgi:hypothetical protein